jgi:replication-associated recombination protein RarA
VISWFSKFADFKWVNLYRYAPGIGKTTLAHVIANHAGYRVVEVNASVGALYSC